MNETPAPLSVPDAFSGKCREVDPGACFDWLRRGWSMFLTNPGIWIGASALLMVMCMAIFMVPLFGQIAAHLLAPLFGAGMLKICQRINDGETPEIPDLFAGFRHNSGQLVMVGVYFALGIFGIAFFVFLLANSGIIGGTITGRIGSFSFSFSGMLLAGLLVVVLSTPVIMATWYAPAMVLLHDMKPYEAMRASFQAGAKNLVPTLIFGVFLVVGLFFAILPALFGLILFLPVFSGAVYASYRDIFVEV